MEWVIFALIGPAFWTLSNFIDKFAIEKMTKGIADYAFFGSIGPIIVLMILPVFFNIHTPVVSVLAAIMLGGFILNYAYMTYGVTLAHTDASRVIPIFQLRSLIVLIVGVIFFGEYVRGEQLIGFFIAMAGVLLLSLDTENLRNFRLNKWTLLALGATIAFATVLLINDFAVENLDIPSVIFFFDAGFLTASISFLLFPVWRKQIVDGLKTATWKKYALFALNDAADELGQLFSKLALAAAPAAALVSVIQGIHSFYVLITGIVLTVWFPHIIKEDISRKMLVQKCLGAFIIFVGIAVIHIGVA